MISPRPANFTRGIHTTVWAGISTTTVSSNRLFMAPLTSAAGAVRCLPPRRKLPDSHVKRGADCRDVIKRRCHSSMYGAWELQFGSTQGNHECSQTVVGIWVTIFKMLVWRIFLGGFTEGFRSKLRETTTNIRNTTHSVHRNWAGTTALLGLRERSPV